MAKQKNEAEYPPLRTCASEEERVALVREVMAAGHSNLTAARALETTPGTIAGIRFKHHIPSMHTKQGAAVDKRIETRLPKDRLRFTTQPPPEDRPKLTTNWRVQCEFESCGYEAEPGTNPRRCKIHLHK